jgi:hypothetical protein
MQMSALRSMRLHSLVLSGLALLFGRFSYGVRNMPYAVEGFPHPAVAACSFTGVLSVMACNISYGNSGLIWARIFLRGIAVAVGGGTFEQHSHQ